MERKTLSVNPNITAAGLGRGPFVIGGCCCC